MSRPLSWSGHKKLVLQYRLGKPSAFDGLTLEDEIRIDIQQWEFWDRSKHAKENVQVYLTIDGKHWLEVLNLSIGLTMLLNLGTAPMLALTWDVQTSGCILRNQMQQMFPAKKESCLNNERLNKQSELENQDRKYNTSR